MLFGNYLTPPQKKKKTKATLRLVFSRIYYSNKVTGIQSQGNLSVWWLTLIPLTHLKLFSGKWEKGEEWEAPSKLCVQRTTHFIFRSRKIQSCKFSTIWRKPVSGNMEFWWIRSSCHRKKCVWSQGYEQSAWCDRANRKASLLFVRQIWVRAGLGGFYWKVPNQLQQKSRTNSSTVGRCIRNIKPGWFYNHIGLSYNQRQLRWRWLCLVLFIFLYKVFLFATFCFVIGDSITAK